MIITCPKYESDGKTLSPLAGQAVVVGLMPGRYGVVATPGADRITRGEEWLQTNTLDRSEEHTSELQSPYDLVCRLLPEKKKTAVAPLCWESRTFLTTVSGSDTITLLPHQGYLVRTQPNTQLQGKEFAVFMAAQCIKLLA